MMCEFMARETERENKERKKSIDEYAHDSYAGMRGNSVWEGSPQTTVMMVWKQHRL